MNDRKGFTLIEVLVSVAIVSILSAIAYPAFGSWCQRANFQSEVSKLVSSLRSAKVEALKTGAYVVIDADSTGYSVFVDNSPAPGEAGDWVRQENERQLVNCRLKNGLTLTSNFPDNKARFSCRPGLRAGRFILTDIDGHKMDVIVSMVGRIRVQ
jgi:prepilin-type N-terminal cleavage/methylation domain-containing protein